MELSIIIRQVLYLPTNSSAIVNVTFIFINIFLLSNTNTTCFFFLLFFCNLLVFECKVVDIHFLLVLDLILKLCVYDLISVSLIIFSIKVILKHVCYCISIIFSNSIQRVKKNIIFWTCFLFGEKENWKLWIRCV